ncbi:hypothetical protein M9458_024473, partial [Cirrhinus mrigala]
TLSVKSEEALKLADTASLMSASPQSLQNSPTSSERKSSPSPSGHLGDFTHGMSGHEIAPPSEPGHLNTNRLNYYSASHNNSGLINS